jgi:hypothetical protein
MNSRAKSIPPTRPKWSLVNSRHYVFAGRLYDPSMLTDSRLGFSRIGRSGQKNLTHEPSDVSSAWPGFKPFSSFGPSKRHCSG